MAVHYQHVIAGGADFGLHLTLGGVVFQLIGKVLRVGGKVHYRYHVNFVFAKQSLPDQGLEYQPPDAAKSINRNLHKKPPVQWFDSSSLEKTGKIVNRTGFAEALLAKRK
jgi:hypothetical protein